MAWVVFEDVIGHVIWSQDFGTEYWKFFGLFLGSSKLCGDLVVILGLRSSGFVVCFDVPGIRH